MIAQIETVGAGARPPRRAAGGDEEVRERAGYVLYALMVTDILAKGTEMLVAGERRRSSARSAPGVDGDRPAGRHEPQEAGRAEVAGGAVKMGSLIRMALRKQKSRKDQVAELASTT